MASVVPQPDDGPSMERHARQEGKEGFSDHAERGSEQATRGEIVEVRNQHTTKKKLDIKSAKRGRMKQVGDEELEISLEEDVFSLSFLAMVELTGKKKIWSKQGNRELVQPRARAVGVLVLAMFSLFIEASFVVAVASETCQHFLRVMKNGLLFG